MSFNFQTINIGFSIVQQKVLASLMKTHGGCVTTFVSISTEVSGTKIHWHMVAPTSTSDFSEKVGLNLALGLVTS